MSASDALHSLRPARWACALVLLLALGVVTMYAAPPAAPPIIQDAKYANLFFGAIPPPIAQSGGSAPVIVFVHGLSGNYEDWIEASNCPSPAPPPPAPACSSPRAGNDMYDFAYNAGFRVAIMSLNADNSNNTASIQTNAAMLQQLFPEILSYFGVSKVFFVAHSKGGLDLEAALVSPQWLGMANSVLELGTPNQGDALANWIFLPANKAIGQQLGLLTPAVQSLEISNVLQLRAQWDPIFQNAGIQFYTISGNTDACPPGDASCSTAITGPILTKITGGPSKAPANDGFVTRPESLLPSSYAMEIGIEHADHFELRLGDLSFNYVYGRVIDYSTEQPGPVGPGAQLVGTGGFGDIHNTWAWSMAYFNNNLYVGTGRETYCVTSATAAITLGLPGLYPPAIGDCTPDYHLLPLQAEIWQYNPATLVWTRVFQSPNSLSTVDNAGATVATARDIGFRGLQVVNEPGGVTALYAGGVTSGSIFEPSSAPGTWPPPRIMRSVDGVNWAPLPQNPGSFLGNLTVNGHYCATNPCTPPDQNFPNYSIRSAAQLNGTLFLQVGDFPGVGRVFSSVPGANPALGDNCGLPACFQWASPLPLTVPDALPGMPVWILETFNNFMYAGTGSPPGAGPAEYGVWKTNGVFNASGSGPGGTCEAVTESCYTWNYVVTNGGFAQNEVADYAMSMQIFTDPTYCVNGCLYVGTDRPNELVRIHPDTTGQVQVAGDNQDSWDLVVGNPRTVPPGYPGAGEYVYPISGIGQYFDNGFTGHFWRMGVGSQGLYMGTWDFSSNNAFQPNFSPLWNQEFGTDVWRTYDGVHWSFVTKMGFGDGNNTGSRSFASTPFGLYMGTARSIGGTQVFLVDNGTLDYNGDGVVDAKDVARMSARVGQKAAKGDLMDLNGDGKITQADVQLLRSHCTYKNCAAKAAGANAGPPLLATPVLHSQPGPLGGNVSITWGSVTGAQDYLVFRIAESPSESSPAPAVEGCGGNNAPAVCSQLPESVASNATKNPLFGYPGPPVLLMRVDGTTYSETAPNSLQSLYFVRAEDANGNLSAPSNVVGGPSLSTQ
jgi:Dockerin type I domain